MLRADELLGHAEVELLEQRIKIAVDIQDSTWLSMESQLAPSDDLAKFVQRAVPAGQRDEGIGQLGHPCLTLMHGGDDVKCCDAVVCDLSVRERFRNDANDLSASFHGGIGNGPHQSHIAATVDKCQTAFRQQPANSTGGLLVGRISSPA